MLCDSDVNCTLVLHSAALSDCVLLPGSPSCMRNTISKDYQMYRKRKTTDGCSRSSRYDIHDIEEWRISRWWLVACVRWDRIMTELYIKYIRHFIYYWEFLSIPTFTCFNNNHTMRSKTQLFGCTSRLTTSLMILVGAWWIFGWQSRNYNRFITMDFSSKTCYYIQMWTTATFHQ